VVARVLDQLGVEHAVGRRWGDAPSGVADTTDEAPVDV
jgi:hypothetical protein